MLQALDGNSIEKMLPGAQPDNLPDQFCCVMSPECCHHTQAVRLDRPAGNAQQRGYLLVGTSFKHVVEDLTLPSREPVQSFLHPFDLFLRDLVHRCSYSMSRQAPRLTEHVEPRCQGKVTARQISLLRGRHRCA